MKVPVVHRVPLSPPAMAILQALKPQRVDPKAFIFPGLRPGTHLSDRAMLQLVRGMQERAAQKTEDGQLGWVDELGRPVVPHGFRSTFRQWVAEATDYRDSWAEAALAHTKKDKVEGSYQRSDLLEKRRPMMVAWAEYVVPGRHDVTD
jgi:integrase